MFLMEPWARASLDAPPTRVLRGVSGAGRRQLQPADLPDPLVVVRGALVERVLPQVVANVIEEEVEQQTVVLQDIEEFPSGRAENLVVALLLPRAFGERAFYTQTNRYARNPDRDESTVNPTLKTHHTKLRTESTKLNI